MFLKRREADFLEVGAASPFPLRPHPPLKSAGLLAKLPPFFEWLYPLSTKQLTTTGNQNGFFENPRAAPPARFIGFF